MASSLAKASSSANYSPPSSLIALSHEDQSQSLPSARGFDSLKPESESYFEDVNSCFYEHSDCFISSSCHQVELIDSFAYIGNSHALSDTNRYCFFLSFNL